MTVLVTGAPGDVGAAVLAGLAAAGEPVRASSRSLTLPGRAVGVGSDSPYLKEEFGPCEAADADHRPGREWCLDEALLDLKEASQVGLHAGTAVVVVGFVILGAALAGVFPALIGLLIDAAPIPVPDGPRH